jgi:hypothetical protein
LSLLCQTFEPYQPPHHPQRIFPEKKVAPLCFGSFPDLMLFCYLNIFREYDLLVKSRPTRAGFAS